MKASLFLTLLLTANVFGQQITFNASPNQKTLIASGINPALSAAFRSALTNTYRPNPNPFNVSYVSCTSNNLCDCQI